MPARLADALGRCFAPEPSARPSTSELLRVCQLLAPSLASSSTSTSSHHHHQHRPSLLSTSDGSNASGALSVLHLDSDATGAASTPSAADGDDDTGGLVRDNELFRVRPPSSTSPSRSEGGELTDASTPTAAAAATTVTAAALLQPAKKKAPAAVKAQRVPSVVRAWPVPVGADTSPAKQPRTSAAATEGAPEEAEDAAGSDGGSSSSVRIRAGAQAKRGGNDDGAASDSDCSFKDASGAASDLEEEADGALAPAALAPAPAPRPAACPAADTNAKTVRVSLKGGHSGLLSLRQLAALLAEPASDPTLPHLVVDLQHQTLGLADAHLVDVPIAPTTTTATAGNSDGTNTSAAAAAAGHTVTTLKLTGMPPLVIRRPNTTVLNGTLLLPPPLPAKSSSTGGGGSSSRTVAPPSAYLTIEAPNVTLRDLVLRPVARAGPAAALQGGGKAGTSPLQACVAVAAANATLEKCHVQFMSAEESATAWVALASGKTVEPPTLPPSDARAAGAKNNAAAAATPMQQLLRAAAGGKPAAGAAAPAAPERVAGAGATAVAAAVEAVSTLRPVVSSRHATARRAAGSVTQPTSGGRSQSLLQQQQQQVALAAEHQGYCAGVWVRGRATAQLLGCTLASAPGDGLVVQGAAKVAGTHSVGNKECGFMALSGGKLELVLVAPGGPADAAAMATLGPCVASGNGGEAGFAACQGGAITTACVVPSSAPARIEAGEEAEEGGARVGGRGRESVLSHGNLGHGFLARGRGSAVLFTQTLADLGNEAEEADEGNGGGAVAELCGGSGFAALSGGRVVLGRACAARRCEQHGLLSRGEGSALEVVGAGCAAESCGDTGFLALEAGAVLRVTAPGGAMARGCAQHGFMAQGKGAQLLLGSTTSSAVAAAAAALHGGRQRAPALAALAAPLPTYSSSAESRVQLWLSESLAEMEAARADGADGALALAPARGQAARQPQQKRGRGASGTGACVFLADKCGAGFTAQQGGLLCVVDAGCAAEATHNARAGFLVSQPGSKLLAPSAACRAVGNETVSGWPLVCVGR